MDAKHVLDAFSFISSFFFLMQDVLLYNFFGASPLKNQWRVIYEYMKEQSLLDSFSPRAFPRFDRSKHSALCSELKQLYVAITRTRQTLWICETAGEYSKPMFEFWEKLCLVQRRHLDSSLAQAMQAASSPDDWRLRGIKVCFFFHDISFLISLVNLFQDIFVDSPLYDPGSYLTRGTLKWQPCVLIVLEMQ